MTSITGRDVEHIFESLRKGLVPERGIDTFAVGIEKQRNELHRQLELVGSHEGSIKFLRGGYGCGKTFMARLALLDAQARGFATSFVVVSDNDLHFHRFDDVYRKVMTELGTASCPRGALGDILDRWIGAVEETLVNAGVDDTADDFDERVRKRLNEDLVSLTGGNAPEDFIRVIQTIFDLKQDGNVVDAGALISWLCGSGNVAASAKKVAQVKGDIGSRDALHYLRGVLEIVKAAGYKGLVIVIDEAETILRMRKDSRHKSLNGIRQIADAASSYPGLLWLFTGTAEFFDTRHGVAGLTPLHDRIRFISSGGFASLRQAQLELKPFDTERLKAVALRLREIYPGQDRSRLESAVSQEFIERLVANVTAGFKGDVGIVPRQFLREFVTQMDLVEENKDYSPAEQYGFKPTELSTEEQTVLSGTNGNRESKDDELVPTEDAW
ncbi:putative ATP/GTP binding protein [Planctopirus limnophila DSM 3776]|uniref:Putative ATP/GTP binding protein n=1 Tax=Planctopirus limnophila (strain ATCC 43296 / DSM 3776 / IFAM 1008 / Mu 290) TaxID=521674 RepID=D5SSU5_PLAL2|nr:BREX system ATP-binding protein BrxD [Planctopirus limnophila]ADG68896.1 putative ATP/GTP binding protein [Planctopirus limnophila DSM 3776]